MPALPSTRTLTTCLLLITLGACAAPNYQFGTLEQVRRAADPANSNYESYRLTGAVWVENQLLLINSEFDFGIAMGISGVGPAIAAGMRINRNKELAAMLQNMPPLQLNNRFRQALNQCVESKDDYRINVFAMLYGQPRARLEVFAELSPAESSESENPYRFIYLSDWRPVKGPNGWVWNNGSLINESLDKALPALAQLIQRNHPLDDPQNPMEAFTVTGDDSSQHMEGYLLSKDDQRAVVRLGTIPNTVASYPAAIVEWRK